MRPDLGVLQAMLLLVAWIHGCIGVYFWLRLKRFFPRMAPVLLGLAVLLPVLALLGFYQQDPQGCARKCLATAMLMVRYLCRLNRSTQHFILDGKMECIQ